MEWNDYQAVLFDLDGVITPTADVHMRAWSDMFNAFLRARGQQEPYTDDDYFEYVDGKPRYNGVRDFLRSRGIILPEGTAQDDPSEMTVSGLGNRKNQVFNTIIERDGVQAYEGSVALIEQLVASGHKLAVVSSSKNAPAVLRAAKLTRLFAVVIDGNVVSQAKIPGKPAPDTFEHAAAMLDVPPSACVVIEDAISGVQAGAAGDFGLVIGVDRGVGAGSLKDAGADVVVGDLGELVT